MKLNQINPFIRYAQELNRTQYFNKCRCIDCRLFYVAEGQIQIEIQNRTYKISRDSLFYCSSGNEYHITFEKNTSVYVVNFDLTNDRDYIVSPLKPQERDGSEITVFRDEIDGESFLNTYTVQTDAYKYYLQIKEILKEFCEQKIYYKERSSAILKDVLISLHRPTGSNNQILNDVINYINKNYARKLSNHELAKIVNYHEYYLNAIFKEYTGTNLHSYVMNVRIINAQRLLETSKLSINDIALETGFNSFSHFSTCFKKKLGMSPSDYRKFFYMQMH